MIFKNFKILLALFFITLLQGCNKGLPEKEITKTKLYQAKIEQSQVSLDKRKEAFEELKKTDSWDFLKTYNEKENWEDHFKIAQEQIVFAKGLYDQWLTPIISRNNSDDTKKLVKYLQHVNVSLFIADLKSEKPQKRIKLLLDTKNNVLGLKVKSEEVFEKITKTVKDTEAVVIQAKSDFPNKEIERIAPLGPIHASSEKAKLNMAVLEEEYAKISSNTADYAKIADSVNVIRVKLNMVESQSSGLIKEINKLYDGVSK